MKGQTWQDETVQYLKKGYQDEIDALCAELGRYETARQEDAKRLEQVKRERDAWKSIVLGLSPDGWLQSGMMEECIANCGNEPEQGHAAGCQFAAALAEGDE